MSGLCLLYVMFGFASCSLNRPVMASNHRFGMTKERMERLLGDLDPWPIDSMTYGDKSWARIIAVAKEFQRADSESIEKALYDYQNETILDEGLIHTDKRVDFGSIHFDPIEYDKRLEQDGKLFLLMRVVFELPEHAVPAERSTYFGWVTHGDDFNHDGTVNVGWPVSWTGKTPKLLSGQTELQGIGDVYDVLSEYKYFYRHYHFRSL